MMAQAVLGRGRDAISPSFFWDFLKSTCEHFKIPDAVVSMTWRTRRFFFVIPNLVLNLFQDWFGISLLKQEKWVV